MIDSHEIFPSSHNIFRKDKNRHGHGLAIAVESKQNAVRHEELEICSEMLWCEIVSGVKSIFICLFYRPHTTGVEHIQHLEESFNILQKKYPKGNYDLLLTGDFNLPMIEWSQEYLNRGNNVIAESFLTFVHINNLTQHVFLPTRYGLSDNILDLVFSRDPNLIENVNVIPGLSDHEIVSFDIKINSSNVKLEKKTVYNFNNENINELREAIRTSNFSELVENGANINEAWEKWKYHLTLLMDTIIPKKHVKLNLKHPWLNNHLKKMYKKQKSLHKIYVKKKAESARRKLQSFRKLLRSKLQISESRYVKHLSLNMDNGKRRFWKFVKAQQSNSNGIGTLKLFDFPVTFYKRNIQKYTTSKIKPFNT